MFVRKKKKAESRWQIQVVESLSIEGKVRQKIVKNIGTAYSEQERDDLTAIGEKEIIKIKNLRMPVLPFADPEEFHGSKKKQSAPPVNLNMMREEKRLNQGFDMIMKPLFKELDIDLGADETNEIIGSLAVARAFKPTSKLEAQKILAEKFDKEIDLHKIYRSLDVLADKADSVKKKIGKKSISLLENKVDVMFFDVTTLAFESQNSDDLRAFGFSKDCKFNEVQVVLAMVTTTEGLPITYQVFPGIKFEGHTLLPIVEELKRDFEVNQVILAADRGMFSAENLEALNDAGIKYVVGAKLKTMKKVVKDKILSEEGIKPSMIGNDFIWTKSVELSGDEEHQQKLVISYSSRRAKKDAFDRNRLIDRLVKKAKDGKIKLDKLISNAGTKKYITTDGESTVEINQKKVESDSAWDGIHGLITNSNLTEKEVLERYRGLWQIEEAFRINKHDLKMRPIFHWKPKRIRGHICLCFITYALSKHIQFSLKKAGVNLSVKRFLEELNEIQASILVHKISGKKYLMPSALSSNAQAIFSAIGITPKTSVTPL